MTSQSPRIYIYKITFEEVSYYYYGVHKEKKFGEYYMGSPVTNKWCWDFYIPKKQILEIFDYTDKGWIEAQKVEGRLIRPVFNSDKWCLNENCLGVFSLDKKGKAGKIGGKKVVECGLGYHSLTMKEKSEIGKLGGTKSYEMKVGIHGLTSEQKTEARSKGGNKTYELNSGVFSRSQEKIEEDCRKGGIIVNSQKWICLETGYISCPGGLARYQRKRGIDTSKRKRIE